MFADSQIILSALLRPFVVPFYFYQGCSDLVKSRDYVDLKGDAVLAFSGAFWLSKGKCRFILQVYIHGLLL